MKKYSLETLQSMTEFQGNNQDATGTLNLFVPALKATIEVRLSLVESKRLMPRSVETINDIANLSDAVYAQVLRLLYIDALRTREEVDFVDPDRVTPLPRNGLLARLLCRKNAPHLAMLAPTDPRHPCHFEDGINSVESKVKWLGFRIDEHSKPHARLCLLDCLPRWEDEHGVTIVFRDGVPLSTGPYDLDLEAFATV